MNFLAVVVWRVESASVDMHDGLYLVIWGLSPDTSLLQSALATFGLLHIVSSTCNSYVPDPKILNLWTKLKPWVPELLGFQGQELPDSNVFH